MEMEKFTPGFPEDEMATEKKPFFSVVIATYNRKNTILRAIDSLLLQTEKDWEAIIVDDGSTDNTYCKLDDLLEKHSNIHYIKHENKGAAEAKNSGLKIAEGKFFTFLDSDDEYTPDHLESRKKILLENPAVQFLSGGIKIIGSPFVPDRFNSDEQVHLDQCEIGGTFFICKKLFYELNGFRKIHLGEDADLFDRILNAGYVMMKTDLPTYIYHKETEGSITNMFEKPGK
jgi:glycosyltransferase involved in cell wall biosynthesis